MENAQRRLGHVFGHLIPEPTSGKCPVVHNSSSKCPAMNTSKCPAMDTSKCPAFTNGCPMGNCKGCSSCSGTKIQGKTWQRLLSGEPIRVCVTGAAGNIAYSLIFMIASGHMFGPKQQVVLHLLDIPPMEKVLKGVEMEIADCAFPLVTGVLSTSDPKTAFMNVDVAILVGAFPRQKGMERKDLLKKNAEIFKVQGKALNDYASRHVRILVVGNPANTNCLIAMNCAPDLPRSAFTALTRLDHNRAKAQVAKQLNAPLDSVHNVVIWGNHSATQYPDANYGYVGNHPGIRKPVRAAINNDQYLQNDFIATVQQRGAEIIKARNSSSAASAAWAVVNHVRDWVMGTAPGEVVSMAVCSDGSYDIPKGLIYSFPVTCRGGEWSIVSGLQVNEFSRKKLEITTQELQEEKNDAFGFLGLN